MADGDIVRKITISATGENVDNTTASVNRLSAANDNSAKSSGSANSSFVNLAAGLYVAKTGYEALTSVSDGASESLGKTANAAKIAIGEILSFPIHKISEIWQEGIDKLNSYVALSEKAGALSVEYYQRLVKGATDAQKPADEYLKIITSINSALDRKLGANGNQNGSIFNTEILELQKNGNLQGQTADVNRLNNAVTGPEQLSAGLKLIQGAVDAGEKLTAFKLTNTLLGPEATQNLKNDNDYIFQMLKSIADVKEKDIIKQADVDRAVSMTTEMANAKKIIDNWFKPKAQSDWSELGIGIEQLWLNANKNFADALVWLDKILGKTKEIASVKPDPEGSIWTKFGDAFTDGGKDMPNGVSRLSDADRAFEVARTNLGSQLGNKNNVTNARQAAQRADDWLTPDQSSPPPAATTTAPKVKDERRDAFDRAEEQLLKYIKVTEAAAKSIDATAVEQEKLKAVAQLTAAAEKEHIPITAELAKKMDELGNRAGNAAGKLNDARIASQITFGKNTSLLSPDDVAIASQLKSKYTDVATALASVEAQGIRTNAALSGLSGTFSGTLTTGLTDILDGTKSVSNGFKDMSKIIIRAIEEMIVKLLIVGPLMRALQSGLGGGISVPGFNPIAGISGHAAGTDSSPGGWHWVGENGPELMNVPKGSQVLPNGVMPEGGGVNAPISIHIDATGADAAGLARVQEQLADLKTSLPATIVKTVQKAKTNRVL